MLRGSGCIFAAHSYGSMLLIVQALLSAHFFRDSTEFGRINAVMWAYSLAEVLTSSGLTLALFQHRGDPEKLIGPVWTFQAVRGVALGILIGLFGTYLSFHYGDPLIAPLAWTAALSAPINGLAGLGPTLAMRDLHFRRSAFFSAIETTLAFAACCALIVTLRSAWAMVLGLNSLAVARVVSSYLMRPERPRLDFRWGKLRPFWGFAAFTLLATVLAFGNERGDDLAVGTLLGLPSLGLYHLAFLYANLPGLKLGQALGNVILPTFAHLRDSPERLRRAVRRFLLVMGAMSALTFLPLVAAAPWIFQAIGEGHYAASAGPFRILCIFGALRFFQFASEAIFNSLGRAVFVFRAQLIQFATLGCLVVPLTLGYGLHGAAWAVVTSITAASAFSAASLGGILRRMGAVPVSPEREETAPARVEAVPTT